MVKEIDSEVLTKQPEGIRAKENEQIMLHSFFVRPFDLQRTGAM